MEKKITATIEVTDAAHCGRPSGLAFFGGGCQFLHGDSCFIFSHLAKEADGQLLRHADCLKAEQKNGD